MIPSRKKWLRIIFFSVGLVGLLVVSEAFLRAIARGEGGVFLILWLGFWAILEILCIYHLLWELIGKEEIEVGPDSIAIRRAILGIGLSKVYAWEDISHMRIDDTGKIEPYSLGSEVVSLNRDTGMIAFDYLEKTIKMAIGVDEAEAKDLITDIQRQFPQYMK